MTRNSLDLGIADSGEKIAVSQYGELTVILESDHATGFRWIENTNARDDLILNLKSQQYIPPEEGSAETAGTEIWSFEANTAGKTGILLEYKAPYEDAVTVKTFEVAVRVKGKE